MRIDGQNPGSSAIITNPAPELDLSIPYRTGGSADSATAAIKFEGLLIANLISQMRESSGVKMFGESPGAQVFEGLFDQMFGESIAKNGGLGLATQIATSMNRIDDQQTAEMQDSAMLVSPVLDSAVQEIQQKVEL
ncbi:MAG: rod-binding protein [Planctomycetota bacterium]